MCFSYMHILCFIKDVGIDGCIHHPCVSNELDQYLSEPLYAQNASLNFSTVAPMVIYEQKCRYLYVLFQMSEKIGKNSNFGAK